MVKKRHFETSRKSEAERLAKLLADLYRAVQYLDLGIESEVDQARTRDPLHHGYSIAAGLMETRRSNLKVTIAACETRLAGQLPALVPA